MPNWCNNVVIIEHKNKTAIDRVVKAFDDKELCNEFIPVPEPLLGTQAPNTHNPKEMYDIYGYESWYDFCIGEWGTKWDVGGDETCDVNREDDKSVTLTFDSAWSPPMGLYDKLSREGYHVTAYYYEAGCAYAGIFRSETGDDFYPVPSTSSRVKELLPKELDEMFGISDVVQEYEGIETDNEEEE